MNPHAFLNGQLVPESEALVPVTDRGFLYGDGLFETIRVCRGRPFRLTQHLDRLAEGAAFLKIQMPFTITQLERHASALIAFHQATEAVLRITLTRGVGERGYLPRNILRPTVVLTLHPALDFDPTQALEWGVITSAYRVPAGDALAGYKTANKLVNVLARMEAEVEGADEALLLDTKGNVVEAASANLFWIQDGHIFTPPTGAGLLPGITRAVTIEICRKLGTPAKERSVTPDELLRSEGVFLTQSVFGVVAVKALNGQPIPLPPQIQQLHRAYCEVLTTE